MHILIRVVQPSNSVSVSIVNIFCLLRLYVIKKNIVPNCDLDRVIFQAIFPLDYTYSQTLMIRIYRRLLLSSIYRAFLSLITYACVTIMKNISVILYI